MTAAPNRCPSWCDGDHPDGRSGVVHRGHVGCAKVGSELVDVVILETASGVFPANVTISGPVFIEIHNLDHADMVKLLQMSGQNQLAALVQRAATILGAAQ